MPHTFKKKLTGPQPVSLATELLVRIVQPLNCQSIVTITLPDIRTDPPSLFIVLALAWMLETVNEHALCIKLYQDRGLTPNGLRKGI